MQSINSLTVRAIENPELLATMSEVDTRHVMTRLLQLLKEVHEKWVEKSDTERIANAQARGDRLLSAKELVLRMGCSRATLARGRQSGQYPFLLKDGGRLVGSEAGLERWIKSRTDRKFFRN